MARKNNMNTATTNIVVEYGGTRHWNCGDSLVEAIRVATYQAYNYDDVVIVVNGVIMPDINEDETFFYSSVEAAKNGKVWVEEAHAFMSQSFKAAIEGGCADLDDLDEEFEESGGWNNFVLDNIYQDIFVYTSVTGEDGQAVVYDEDVAKLCEQNGYDVLPCCKEDREFGDMVSYWLIFAQGGEDKFFEDVYKEEKDMKITDDTAYELIAQGHNMVLDVMSNTWLDLTGICDGFFPDVIPDDFTDKDRRRAFRREMAKRDNHPQRGTSCFRKGYHKAEKAWKRQSRRNDRHHGKAFARDYGRKVSKEAVKDWAGLKSFYNRNGLTKDWFDIAAYGDENGIEVWVEYEIWDNDLGWNDEDGFYAGGEDYYYLTWHEARNLGLVE